MTAKNETKTIKNKKRESLLIRKVVSMAEYLTQDDIFEFAENYRSANGLGEGKLTDEQIAKFVGELQERIARMDYSIPKGSTIIGYSGGSNGTPVWKIVQEAAHAEGSTGFYISDLPAGQLVNNKARTRLEEAIAKITDDEKAASRILGGWFGDARSAWSGFGEFVSLDDFVSAELMGESSGVNGNFVVFSPEEIAENRVFACTEAQKLFENGSCRYINGIDKEFLRSVYSRGAEGRRAFYQIISETSKSVALSVSDLKEQSGLLRKAFGKGGVFDPASSSFRAGLCFDSQGRFAGVDLFSNGEGRYLVSSYSSGSKLVDPSSGDFARLEFKDASRFSQEQVRQAFRDSSVFLDEAGGVISRGFEGTVLDGVSERFAPAA